MIEQLGRYDKAKEMYIAQLKAGLAPYGYEEALLEYRREHNIFEVGDKVVVLTNALGNKYTWMVESIDGIMVEISQVGQPNEWVHYSEIAHTTPKEIKAGRRLSKIKCWSCDKEMSHSDRAENDGFCIHCNAEIEL